MKIILFIHHAAGWGGAPINMINIINALDKTKYKAKVLLLKDSIVRAKLEENRIDYVIANSLFYNKIYTFYSHIVPGNIKWFQINKQLKHAVLWLLNRFYFAPAELRKHSYDIAHLNSSTLTDWLAPCKKKGKVIYHIQEPLTKGTFGLRYLFFRRQVKKYADHIIAISKDNANRINLPEKTSVVYNFTEINAQEVGIDSYNSKKVLYVGGDAIIKGYYTLVDAIDFLDKGIMLYFAGNISVTDKSKLKRIIKLIIPYYRARVLKSEKALQKINTSKNVIILGLQDKIDPLLDEVCLLVSPFTVEHFSRPIIEAFAHKKPVIATRIAGIEEIVQHNVNGLIVEKNSSKNLANAINLLAKNPDLCRKFGQNGYDVAKEKYSSKNISLIEEVYFSL